MLEKGLKILKIIGLIMIMLLGNITVSYARTINITRPEELNEYFGNEKVTVKNVQEAIDNNSNLNNKYKRIAKNIIFSILAEDEEADIFNLRIFYENIKTLNVKEYTKEEFRNEFPNAIGGGANYNAVDNTIYTINEVPIELLAHEMAHVFHSIYREINGDVIVRKEKFTSFNEAMTDMLASGYYHSKSYRLAGAILDYLTPFFEKDELLIYDYNNYGGEYLINILKLKYPSIDIDYIFNTLDKFNESLIASGSGSSIDKKLLDELFKFIELRDYQIYKDYISELMDYDFANFSLIFSNMKNSDLVLDYLELYNTRKQSLGESILLTKEQAQNNLKAYKNVNGIAEKDGIFFPIINNNGNVKKVNTDGTEVELNVGDYRSSTSIDMFSSFITSSMYKYVVADKFGNSDYWKNISEDLLLVNPLNYDEILILNNGNQISKNYLYNLRVEIGQKEDGKVGFRIKDKDNNTIYEIDSNLKKLSTNNIMLSYYATYYSDYLNILELDDILNEDYLKIFQNKGSNKFDNIELVDNEIKFTKEDNIENSSSGDVNNNPNDVENPDTGIIIGLIAVSFGIIIISLIIYHVKKENKFYKI